MKTEMKCLFVLFLSLLAPLRAVAAEVQVFACEPTWGALAQALGGDRVKVYSATTAYQDPHHIQARPSLIARLRRADLLVCNGAELEIGWLPVLLRQAANGKVQSGQPGNFAAADWVTLLEKPERVDRSEGDIHPAGNPHIYTDPRRIGQVAKALSGRLAQIDPGHAEEYAARYRDFDQRWSAAVGRWTEQAAPLRGVKVVVHHRGWVYLMDWLGLVEVSALEPHPGVPPSASHLAEVLAQLQREPARMVVRAAYQSARPAEWLSERAHIPVVVLPVTVGGTEEARDLFGVFDDTVARLLAGLQ